MHVALCYAAQYDINVAYGTLVFLSVPDAKKLFFWCEKLHWYGYKVTYFCEPDLNNELTAIAVGPEAARRLSRLPLALGGGEQNG